MEYALQSPEPGAAEPDPMEVMSALSGCLRTLAQQSREPVQRVALSSAMHSVLAVDARGTALTPVYTWADKRASVILPLLQDALPPTVSGQLLYQETGMPLHPMSPLLKLVWLRHTRPALFAAAHMFVSLKEIVCHQLFGQWLADHSIASASGLYNLQRRDWSDAALATAGVKRAQLSALAAPETAAALRTRRSGSRWRLTCSAGR